MSLSTGVSRKQLFASSIIRDRLCLPLFIECFYSATMLLKEYPDHEAQKTLQDLHSSVQAGSSSINALNVSLSETLQ